MISDKLVTEFGGKFDLWSEEGVGSTFTFTVKLQSQSEIELKGNKKDRQSHADSGEIMFDWIPKFKKNYKVKYAKYDFINQ